MIRLIEIFQRHGRVTSGVVAAHLLALAPVAARLAGRSWLQLLCLILSLALPVAGWRGICCIGTLSTKRNKRRSEIT
jgi:hypothetical protein